MLLQIETKIKIKLVSQGEWCLQIKHEQAPQTRGRYDQSLARRSAAQRYHHCPFLYYMLSGIKLNSHWAAFRLFADSGENVSAFNPKRKQVFYSRPQLTLTRLASFSAPMHFCSSYYRIKLCAFNTVKVRFWHILDHVVVWLRVLPKKPAAVLRAFALFIQPEYQRFTGTKAVVRVTIACRTMNNILKAGISKLPCNKLCGI